jgi:hypothetical protein
MTDQPINITELRDQLGGIEDPDHTSVFVLVPTVAALLDLAEAAHAVSGDLSRYPDDQLDDTEAALVDALTRFTFN